MRLTLLTAANVQNNTLAAHKGYRGRGIKRLPCRGRRRRVTKKDGAATQLVTFILVKITGGHHLVNYFVPKLDIVRCEARHRPGEVGRHQVAAVKHIQRRSEGRHDAQSTSQLIYRLCIVCSLSFLNMHSVSSYTATNFLMTNMKSHFVWCSTILTMLAACRKRARGVGCLGLRMAPSQSSIRLHVCASRGVGGMGLPGAFAPTWPVVGRQASSEVAELQLQGRRLVVTCTNDPASIDAWLTKHVLPPGSGDEDLDDGNAATLMPIGVDVEMQPRFVKGSSAPPLACLQLATSDAVLVAQVLGMTPSELPRGLARLFATPGLRRRILPVGVGVREDVVKLLDALGLRAGGAPAVGVRELAVTELLASCVPTFASCGGSTDSGSGVGGGGSMGSSISSISSRSSNGNGVCGDEGILSGCGSTRLAALAHSPAVAVVNIAELHAWLGLSRGAGHSAGLEALARQLLGFPRWKRRSITMSAWEAWPLDRSQQLYAALDAVASRDVFAFLLDAIVATGGVRPTPRPLLYAPVDE